MSDNTAKRSLGHKMLHSPITRIIIGFLVCGLVGGIGQLLIKYLLGFTLLEKDLKGLIGGVFVATLTVFAYIFLYKYYEKREVSEFSTKWLFKNLSFGIALGVVLQSLTILVIYIKGGYSIDSVNPVLFIIPPLTMAFTSAIVEEIMIRGIFFRLTEELMGSYVALFISAALFGALHLGNPNSSLIMGVGLAIQAGLLLGAAYIYSRNLWFPIAIHFAWNFTQSAIFGASVSGHTIKKTLLTSTIEGEQWFTGGPFGPEGSIQATLFCLIATVVLLILSHRKNNIIPFKWPWK